MKLTERDIKYIKNEAKRILKEQQQTSGVQSNRTVNDHYFKGLVRIANAHALGIDLSHILQDLYMRNISGDNIRLYISYLAFLKKSNIKLTEQMALNTTKYLNTPKGIAYMREKLAPSAEQQELQMRRAIAQGENQRAADAKKGVIYTGAFR